MARPIETAAKGPHRLISAANSTDRFMLLDDPSVPEPDLNVPIHPIFNPSNFANANPIIHRNIQQSLKLASTFLQYDSVLEWFVGPLLGLPLLDSKSGKSYLSDPLANKNRQEKRSLIQRVRQALNCLAHSIHFQFYNDVDVKFYARTTMCNRRPVHTATCTQHFHPTTSVRIELRRQYWEFLQHHYTGSSLCDRLRNDFSLAVALVHETCHAVGVMRRGNLNEPHIRIDHLDKPEFGYAWENFMFGGIINPFDRSSSTISFLMRKVWADDSTVYAAGGKEWAAVPMAYIAQWFQKSTWEKIAKCGPTAISAPPVHLKLRAYENRYTVLTDNEDAIADVRKLQTELIEQCRNIGRFPGPVVAVLAAKTALVCAEELQRFTVSAPTRAGQRLPQREVWLVTTKRVSSPRDTMIRSYSNPLPAARYAADATEASTESLLKRRIDDDEDECSSTWLLSRPSKIKRVKR